MSAPSPGNPSRWSATRNAQPAPSKKDSSGKSISNVQKYRKSRLQFPIVSFWRVPLKPRGPPGDTGHLTNCKNTVKKHSYFEAFFPSAFASCKPRPPKRQFGAVKRLLFGGCVRPAAMTRRCLSTLAEAAARVHPIDVRTAAANESSIWERSPRRLYSFCATVSQF